MLRTRPFPPEPRGFKEAKSLVKAGYEVHVLAWDRSSEHPKEEKFEDVSVRRFRIPSGYNDFMKFLVTLPLFWLCSLIRTLRLRPQVVHCADLDTMPVGALAKRILGCALVYDAYENYPEMVRGSAPETIVNYLDRMDRRLASMADLVLIVWSTFRERYPEALEVPNIPEGREFEKVTDTVRDDARKRLGVDDKFVIGYVGVFMKGRGIEQVLSAVKDDPDAIFLIGGFGQEEGTIRKLVAGVKEARYIGFVEPGDVPSIISACDAIAEISDPSNRNYRMGVGNKVFEAMSAGVPVIVAKGSTAEEFVQDTGCGYAVEFGNVDETKKVISMLERDRALARSVGEKGRIAARERWNWETVEKDFIEGYRKAMEKVDRREE